MIFRSVLIANRGEIACRIIRTLRETGLRSVAVYSDADENMPHVRLANDAVHIGASPAADSYLNIEKIIEAAKVSGAEAVHPGYGFLSENPDFARACTEAGLVFIGPSPEAVKLMGDKAAAKRHMIEADVPILPGYQGADQVDETLFKEASRIGFPLMVKAAAGGGGRGMRLVTQEKDLPQALSAARAEALSAFGSDSLILERAVTRPRHVEVQIFGDQYGNIIHLGERDCSVQRRHQKVLEEAPCPVMTEALREQMGEAAIKAARSVNYVGAGTVEFLLDSSGAFFFLEMNTRLQVEHPVTEMITGLDLVALQIRVAQGEALGLSQKDISLSGHAIEARLYAENPAKGFLPATGRVEYFSVPDGVRIDSGIEMGSEISPFYDPMLAKIIAHGPDRETARRRLVRALEDTVLFGVDTNRSFLIQSLREESFVAGEATTAFIDETFSDEDLAEKPISRSLAVMSGLTHFLALRAQNASEMPNDLLGWFSAAPLEIPFQYGDLRIEVVAKGPHQFDVTCGDFGETLFLERWDDNVVTYRTMSGRKTLRWCLRNPAEIYIQRGAASFHLTNSLATRRAKEKTSGAGEITAPLHGALTEVFVAAGDAVKIGTRLAVIEAMKMQHDILADMDGTVSEVFAEAGSQITANAPLFKLES
jgi:geranyl-CoA carboxylase alpha subunit